MRCPLTPVAVRHQQAEASGKAAEPVTIAHRGGKATDVSGLPEATEPVALGEFVPLDDAEEQEVDGQPDPDWLGGIPHQGPGRLVQLHAGAAGQDGSRDGNLALLLRHAATLARCSNPSLLVAARCDQQAGLLRRSLCETHNLLA
eukprot:1892969-Rhodomonas_salina.1